MTVLCMGKDGIGVTADHFRILARQAQARGIKVWLIVYHGVDTQRRNHGLELSPHWVYSINNLGKYYATFWLSKLAANMNGQAHDPDYQVFIAELQAKADARAEVDRTVSFNAYLTDRGRSNARRQHLHFSSVIQRDCFSFGPYLVEEEHISVNR